MVKIGYRTIKTAIGTPIAIMIAQWFHFPNFVSAGIITILCIQNTKKKSLHAAWTRFLACMIAMVGSSIIFQLFHHPAMIGVLLLFFIPITVYAKISEGIVTSSVIILHVYSANEINLELLMNEFGIIVVGIGIALIMNLYMPSVEGKLYSYQQQLEKNFEKIFEEIIYYLRTNKDRNWDGKELVETANLLEKAISLSSRHTENYLLKEENTFYYYFKMREKQLDILERVLPIVTSISHQVDQAKMIADFMEDLSHHIHPGNTAALYIKKLYNMKKSFEQADLPQTREEFEARAALFHFLWEMKQYLRIKSSFKGLNKQKTLA
ncbi:uncharacterized membrane protein YgaE (UPF0421/DUF939 family) [Oikeobacillus pervagus]|uniref:Uncharacterized membrane protein YgaE (UPF0421/DUF939 family) n=1 Tax=Oikeobacillus pervagus TaxID=1325931 RepID=A0AAJ1SWC9_9BACI|nr:aromatic acid exporter family protein [Oikeobacillus pervagus]MDQ0213799.1 uncharacterized membrane protein YgaE (UPF0421/DUF939 family) [Oikeobacillus pervagus]